MVPKKKRCIVCRKMFRPDARVGDRQRACRAEACQRRRRQQTQLSWRSRNPSYPIAYRLTKRAAAAAACDESLFDGQADLPPPLRLPEELTSFPWDLAQAHLGFAGADLLAVLALVLVGMAREVKDERWVERSLAMRVYAATGRDP